MLAEFTIYPIQTEHSRQEAAPVIEMPECTGRDYRLGPLSTAVEGSLDEVLAAIKNCHEAVAKKHGRVITTIVIDDRKTGPRHQNEMINRVEENFGGRVPRADMDPEC